jgi:single-strand DNA-binding protein
MASFNLCTFIGRVGTEPEQHESQDGVQVSRFRLAIDTPSKEKESQWLTILSFKKLSELVKSYVKKGSHVLVCFFQGKTGSCALCVVSESASVVE